MRAHRILKTRSGVETAARASRVQRDRSRNARLLGQSVALHLKTGFTQWSGAHSGRDATRRSRPQMSSPPSATRRCSRDAVRRRFQRYDVAPRQRWCARLPPAVRRRSRNKPAVAHDKPKVALLHDGSEDRKYAAQRVARTVRRLQQRCTHCRQGVSICCCGLSVARQQPSTDVRSMGWLECRNACGDGRLAARRRAT